MASSSHSISLTGSSDLVTEFFTCGVNSILYQRGIYPPESFSPINKYGLSVWVSKDPGVQKFLNSVLSQMRIWLSARALNRVVVVIASVATKKVMERWSFDVNVDADVVKDDGQGIGEKDEKVIVREIQAVIRQITASVSYLPLLDEACSFDMLIYTNKDTETPAQWMESGPRIIQDKENVELRSFSTSVHDVKTSVSFARASDD